MEADEADLGKPGADNWVMVLTPNYWGRGRNAAEAKTSLLKAAGHANWKKHVMGNGNKWLVVWVTQPKGLKPPHVNEMGGICAMEEANLHKLYFKYKGNSVVVVGEKEV